MDASLGAALARLDALLVRVCDVEEARAARLRGEAEAGWAAVRQLAAVPAAELAYTAALPEAPLLGAAPPPAFVRARAALGLGALEEEVLLVLLAPHLEPRYARLYAVLQDDVAQGWTLERLVHAALGRTPARAHALRTALSPAGVLAGAGLVALHAGVHPPLARPVDLAPEVRDALLELPPPPALGRVTLAWEPAPRASAAPADGAAPAAFAVVHGAGDRLRLARFLAHEAGRGLVLARCAGREEPEALHAPWRAAVLRGAALVLDVAGLEPHAALALGEELARLCRTWGGTALVLAEGPLPLAAPHHAAPAPGFAERKAQWACEAQARGLALSEEGAARLAANHRLDAARVRDAFDGAADASVAALSEAAARLVQVPLRHALRVAPRRRLEDLVLRDTTRQALERLLFQVRHRDAVAEARGLLPRFPLDAGPLVLFSGRSGTGKTVAAEALAAAVGRPLHVVDLASLVSKWVGQTEKHIDEVLSGGERCGAVLFFDEADALFSARTDVGSANDRHANLEVGFLLQRIERHDGLVILATNLQTSIDEAFLRRFQARIEFPLPEAGERRLLWERLLPQEAAGLDLEALAQRHRLTGGDIRNAALKAVFLAEEAGVPLAQAHVERAVALELHELGRLSRREGTGDDAGARMRHVTEALQDALDAGLRRRFLKEVHVIPGAPTREALAGKRPAVSVALYRLAAGAGAPLRLGFIVSAWTVRAEEEHELLGVLHGLLGGSLPPSLDGRRVTARVQESHDFDLLQRFWSSHGHPVRGSLVLDVEVA